MLEDSFWSSLKMHLKYRTLKKGWQGRRYAGCCIPLHKAVHSGKTGGGQYVLVPSETKGFTLIKNKNLSSVNIAESLFLQLHLFLWPI